MVNLANFPGTAFFESCGWVVILGGSATCINTCNCYMTEKIIWGVTCTLYSGCRLEHWILTNTKLSCFGNLGTNTVTDNTAVAPFIGLLHTGDGEGSTIRPLCITRLPLLTPNLCSWLPLPIVDQGTGSSGTDSECHRIARTDFLTFGMTGDIGRFI